MSRINQAVQDRIGTFCAAVDSGKINKYTRMNYRYPYDLLIPIPMFVGLCTVARTVCMALLLRCTGAPAAVYSAELRGTVTYRSRGIGGACTHRFRAFAVHVLQLFPHECHRVNSILEAVSLVACANGAQWTVRRAGLQAGLFSWPLAVSDPYACSLSSVHPNTIIV